jgi:hypothetical protein
MFSCPPCASKAIPKEYRNTVEALFPQGGYLESEGPSLKAVEAFAGILGIAEDYKKLHSSDEMKEAELLNKFQNNLDILIQKTWVEEAETHRKDALLDRVLPFIAIIEKKDYPEALVEFGGILEELAYLFFGGQSQKDDFAEYVLRIDDQMGLFWWYGGQLKNLSGELWINNIDSAMLYALLLLGICYLTNF